MFLFSVVEEKSLREPDGVKSNEEAMLLTFDIVAASFPVHFAVFSSLGFSLAEER